MAIITPQGSALPIAQPKQAPIAPAPDTTVPDAAALVSAPKEEMLSPRFAALARQTKELRRQQAELKAQEQAWKTKSEQMESDFIPKNKLLEDPLAVLQAQGITYDKIVEMVIASQQPTDPAYKALTTEMKALKDETLRIRDEAAQNKTREYEQAVSQIRNEVKMLIDSDENYSMIKDSGQSEAVVELIKTHFENKGVVLSLEEASTKVENYLLEEAIKVASFKKVKARLQPEVTQETPVAPLPQKTQITPKQITPQPQIKTLTNAQMTAPSKALIEKDRLQRAILAFKGQLT